MITYKDKLVDKIKLSYKSIKEGYKVWILRDVDYVYDWLWHSYVEESKDISKKDFNIDRVESTKLTKFTKIHLVLTFAFILYLV